MRSIAIPALWKTDPEGHPISSLENLEKLVHLKLGGNRSPDNVIVYVQYRGNFFRKLRVVLDVSCRFSVIFLFAAL